MDFKTLFNRVWCGMVFACFTLTRTSAVECEDLFSDSFDRDLSQWVVETELGGSVSLKDGQLDIDVAKGCTVWFKHKLSGPVRITYRAKLIGAGGPHDRVSDLNCFWMATNLKHPDDFFAGPARGGTFKNYNQLQLYYVGHGGGNNTTTRFRRYPGTGKRPLRPEHDLRAPEYMLSANQSMAIELIAQNGRIQYRRDGKIIFDVVDEHPFTSGWFGFRTLTSHIRIDDFNVTELREEP